MERKDHHTNAIRFIEHTSINRVKWDDCILQSAHGLIYNTSLYLDTMAGNWDALVHGDYETVMPLPWRKKYGFRYIYPPAFTQQLGITSKKELDVKTVSDFLDAVPTRFRFIEMNLQPTNPVAVPHTQRKNYLLPITSWDLLQASVSRSALRNISKAVQAGITIHEQVDAREIIALHRHRFNDTIGVKENDYINFTSLAAAFQANGMAYTLGAKNREGALIAGSIYGMFKNRLTFIFNGNSKESLQTGATHLLMEFTLKKFSGRQMILDFEGSDDASFARFYEQYGAAPVFYPFIKINRLPWPFCYFKK